MRLGSKGCRNPLAASNRRTGWSGVPRGQARPYAGKDATEGKTGRRQAAAFPFLAKVGLGDETESVLSYEAHLAPNAFGVIPKEIF